jgi:hypothetical protein
VAAGTQKILNWGLRIAVLASLACCICSNIYRELYDVKTINNRKGEALWQAYLEDATNPGQNIFLKFDYGEHGENAAFAQTIYFLGVYRLYPRRPLVADPSVMINDGHDILRNNDLPDDQWLRDHGVGSVMSIIMSQRQNLPYVKFVRQIE